MKIIDAHCDALLKLVQNESLSFFEPGEELHVQFSHMAKSNVALQIFAMFIPPAIPSSQRFDYALKMADKFHEHLLGDGRLHPICSAADVNRIMSEEHGRGALLALEGADALQGNILYLRTLYRLGLRALGFTWNHRNEAADGVEEPNPGGLSNFGRSVLKEANRLGILIDVSHLSEKGFWNVAELSEKPFMASHSNCKEVHNHVRNLNDEQLQAIFKKNGVVGLTFVPSFLRAGGSVSIKDLLVHMEHALALGGENHLAFGSDFDGITQTMSDLRSMEYYAMLADALLAHYKEEQVRKWLNGNWQRLLIEVLP